MYQSGSKPSISYSKNVTIDEVLAEANSIWDEFRRRRIGPNDHAEQDAFHREMFDAHKDLARAYPIVMRYMCQMGSYSGKVFRRFIVKMTEKPHQSESDYLDLQAEYVMMLYKELNRWDNKTASGVYNAARKQLQDETDEFKKIAKEYEAKTKLAEKTNQKLNITEFAKYVSDNEEFFAKNDKVPISVIADILPDVQDKLDKLLDECDDDPLYTI